MRNLIYVFCLALTLFGCNRPHLMRPPVNTPCEWRIEADEGSTLCNLDWWEQFQDPVLNELILIALKNNLDIKIAISRVFEYYARLGIARADIYPEINGNFSFTRTQNSIAVPTGIPPGIDRTLNNYQLFFNGTWEIDFWGRIASSTAAAYADVLSQIENRRGVVLTIVSNVAEEYIRLRQLDAQLIISKETLDSRIQSLKLAKQRFELGETSELEVKQAESELEVAAIRVIEFERDIPLQENLISVLLGENPHDIERGIQIQLFQYPISIPAGLPSDLLERRPDIVEAENQLIAANFRITEARALLYPQISLTGTYGWQSATLKHFLSTPSEVWQYGFTIMQSIFDAGRREYFVDERRAIRDQALYNYWQTILVAFREVNDALVAYQKNRELVVEHTKQVKVLSDYLHLAKLRYEEGEIDYLNVLDAERSLFDAQLQLAQAQADSFRAVVQLYSALGGGWVTAADAEAALPQCCEGPFQ